MVTEQFTIEQIEDTLDHFATIGVGICWKEHLNMVETANIVSFAEVILMEHLMVAKTIETERAIKGALAKALRVYYFTKGNCSARDTPLAGEVIHFDQK